MRYRIEYDGYCYIVRDKFDDDKIVAVGNHRLVEDFLDDQENKKEKCKYIGYYYEGGYECPM